MASSALDTLPPRPPTPPRETNPETEVSLKAVLNRTPLDSRLSLQTPPNANSPLSAGATNSSLKRMRKRVEWSNHTEYKEPPEYRDGRTPSKAPPLSTRLTSTPKPIKGILKPSPSPNPLASSLQSQLDGPEGQANLAEMLDSTIKQLAGTDRDSKVDAYMMLARALKASNNLPDRVALQDKMSLFMQFIERDLFAKQPNGSPDTSIINHALSLLTTFLHFQAIASTLTSDFGVFIIDHCIRSFEDPAVPKDVVRHLMQVVALQSFSSKVMTSDRVGRLISALHKIEQHLTGKSIVMNRIHIYKRLIKQSRNHMAVHTDWLQDLFTDMLSSIREMRVQAIALGADAGFSLRNEKQLMRKAADILQSTDGEQAYIEFYIQRLGDMIKDKQTSAAVPQIWSAVILFLRGPLEKWQYFSPWLKLVQSAFNTTDVQTKHEANYAWNRFVFLSLIDSSPSSKSLALLGQPLISQLRRKFNAKQVDEGMKLRRIVMGGVCNLLYYSFRPNYDKSSTDTLWELVLQPIMNQLVSLDGKVEGYGDSLTQATRILAGLLDVSSPRSWKEDRVRDSSLVTPDELPPIDAKWTRRNSDKVFQLAGPVLEKKFLDLANTESLAYRLWKSFVGSIASASAKDIKTTDDTMKFIAHAFAILHGVWAKGLTGTDGTLNPKFYPSVLNFVNVLISGLGLLPFTEKRLSVSDDHSFEPAATPSHRPDRTDKTRGTVQAPVHHLFSMFCSIPPNGADDEKLCDFFQAVFEPFFQDKSTKVRIDLAREMLRLLPRDVLSPYGPWVLAARNIRLPLEQMMSSSPSSNDHLLGPEYREIVALLERGLLSHPGLPSDEWFSLFNILSDHVVRECGDAGRALGLIEPVAKVLLDNFFSSGGKEDGIALLVMTRLFEIAKLPRDRQAVEGARRRLWGAPPTASRAPSYDPFDNLYKLQNAAMNILYDSLDKREDAGLIAAAIDAMGGFLTNSLAQAGIKSLFKLQDGICPWTRDDEARLTLSNESPVPKAIRALWDSICVYLVSQGQLNTKDLNQLEPLFSAGFKSKHRYIVNKLAETWNIIFKDEESLECSDSLRSIINALRPQVDIALPGTEESSGEFGAQAQSFIDSQRDLSFIALSSKSSRHDADPTTPSPSSLATKGPMTRKRLRELTPEVVTTRSSKRSRTPRLRHDNSQIQFAPITSSPLVDESQHLTERQKEIRERQKENAGVYAAIRSSPRTRSRAAKDEKSQDSANLKSSRAKETTPEPPASYNEFISSTPTPRRGQALQMDGINDPPSSPPEPRPNPLESEIQTRSRSRTSLENWKFSSPPVSPPASQSQPDENTPSKKPSRRGNRRVRRSRSKSKARSSASLDVIPSSIVEEEAKDESVDKDTAKPTEEPEPELPDDSMKIEETLQVRSTEDDQDVEEPETSENSQTTGAREHSVPKQQTNAADEGTGPSGDSSFAFSEGDESSLMRFVVELESRRCDIEFTKADSQSPEKKECITVSGTSPQEKPKRGKRPASPAAPPAPVEAEQPEAEVEVAAEVETPQSQGKRKRRRGNKSAPSDSRRKRTRAAEVATEAEPETSSPVPSVQGSPAPIIRRSSRTNAGQRSLRYDDTDGVSHGVHAEGPEKAKSKSFDPETARDGGDTDEEVTSQLVTESNAATESQSLHEGSDREVGGDLDEAMVLEAPDAAMTSQDQEATAAEPVLAEAGPQASKPSDIISNLRGGLNDLRKAALSRDDVYQLEDILMDMKRALYQAEMRGRQ